MYNDDEIMQFVYLVATIADPDRIILFGSYAYGNPDDKSDLDLLVIKNGRDFTIDDEAKLATAVYFERKQRKIRTRYDVFFQTDSQVQEIAKNGGAYQDALRKGRVVYERANHFSWLLSIDGGVYADAGFSFSLKPGFNGYNPTRHFSASAF